MFCIGNYINDNAAKQSSTSSYISDDCKVLYIETVIEVAKPVFYQQTNDTLTTIETEYHKTMPQSMNNTQKVTKSIKQIHESSDEELNKTPVKLIRSNHQKTRVQQQMDSGIEYDHLSSPPSTSSSTIFNQKPINKDETLLFPSVSLNSNQNESTLIRRLSASKTKTTKPNIATNSYWDRLKQWWLRALLLGLFLLFLLFMIYFFRLDPCSRSTIIRTVCEKIIYVENQGLPTI